MFRQSFDPVIQTGAETLARLDQVLFDYHELARSDPTLLRKLIPSKEIWRLFIDGIRQQEENWEDFENKEHGYLKAMYTAFQELFDFSSELNIELIQRLHKIATTDVRNTNYDNKFLQETKGCFRDEIFNPGGYYIGFEFKAPNLTVAGLIEFLNRANPQLAVSVQFNTLCYETTTFSDFILTKNCIRAIRACVADNKKLHKTGAKAEDFMLRLRRYLDPALAEKMPQLNDAIKESFVSMINAIGATQNNTELANYLYQLMQDRQFRSFGFLIVSLQASNVQATLCSELNSLIRKFNRSMVNAATPIEKLSAIITLVQSCEQHHPFADANCRVFCMLLLNYLLLRHGFPLAMQNDPNRFDLYAHAELLSEIINAMENTFTLLKKQELFSVKTDSILQELRQTRVLLLQALGITDTVSYFEDCMRIEARNRGEPVLDNEHVIRRSARLHK